MPRDRGEYVVRNMCQPCNGTGRCSECNGAGYYRDNFDGGKNQHDVDTIECICSDGRCLDCGGFGFVRS